MNGEDDGMFKAPPKTKKERVNSLLTSLNEHPENRIIILHALFGEIQEKASKEEVKEFDERNDAIEKLSNRIGKIQSKMAENESLAMVYNTLSQRRGKLINDYNKELDKIELSMRKISDKIEEGKKRYL